jgi:hypothetical protein
VGVASNSQNVSMISKMVTLSPARIFCPASIDRPTLASPTSSRYRPVALLQPVGAGSQPMQ